ncbi:MAG: polyprenyl synthetase family protein [Tissierellia bacterium]|nr:polyprenyl synthetase family protein [Tissierellia bacterium]
MPYKNKIEKALEKIIFSNAKTRLQEAMAYSTLGGGKRVRGQLYLIHLANFASVNEADYDYSALIEMIHAYSLIHDDLPAMDNDSLRRGKPTNHLVYGEDLAILAGDGLLNLTYHWLFKMAKEDQVFITMGEKLAEAAGDGGMVYGQLLDLSYEGKRMDDQLLLEMLKNKTGKLISHPIEAAAIRAGLAEEEVEIWKNLGLKLGLAFQIKDDLLDVDSSAQVLGKTPGKDEISEKNSYVQVYGYDKASQDYENLKKTILEDLARLSQDFELYEYYKGLLERKY